MLCKTVWKASQNISIKRIEIHADRRLTRSRDALVDVCGYLYRTFTDAYSCTHIHTCRPIDLITNSAQITCARCGHTRTSRRETRSARESMKTNRPVIGSVCCPCVSLKFVFRIHNIHTYIMYVRYNYNNIHTLTDLLQSNKSSQSKLHKKKNRFNISLGNDWFLLLFGLEASLAFMQNQ